MSQWEAEYDSSGVLFDVVKGGERLVYGDQIADRLNRLEAIIAALVAAWPTDCDDRRGAPYRPDIPTMTAHRVRTDPPEWELAGQVGRYPNREAAVFAAAGIDPEGEALRRLREAGG